MKYLDKFNPYKPLCLAFRNAISKARREDLSHYRNVAQQALEPGFVDPPKTKSQLLKKMRKAHLARNPWAGSTSTLAAAVWTEQCRAYFRDYDFNKRRPAPKPEPAPEPSPVFTEKQIDELAEKIHKAHLGKAIAARIGTSQPTLSMVLHGRQGYASLKARSKWMPRIMAAYDALNASSDALSAKAEKREVLVDEAARPARRDDLYTEFTALIRKLNVLADQAISKNQDPAAGSVGRRA